MELVIKIPEEEYKNIKEHYEKNDTVEATYSYIYHGTPLEKHDEEVIKETVESIWGKPPYTELLDKIRTEIEQEYNRLGATRADETLELGECLGLKMSLKIIDKYTKGESE